MKGFLQYDIKLDSDGKPLISNVNTYVIGKASLSDFNSQISNAISQLNEKTYIEVSEIKKLVEDDSLSVEELISIRKELKELENGLVSIKELTNQGPNLAIERMQVIEEQGFANELKAIRQTIGLVHNELNSCASTIKLLDDHITEKLRNRELEFEVFRNVLPKYIENRPSQEDERIVLEETTKDSIVNLKEKEKESGILSQFEIDYPRGMGFQISEEGIDSQSDVRRSVSTHDLALSENVPSRAVALIRSCISPSDKDWVFPLQSILGRQATPRSLNGMLLENLRTELRSNPEYCWRKDGLDCFLVVIRNENQSFINANLVKDEKGHIQKVEVSYESSLSLCVQTDTGEIGGKIKGKAIEPLIAAGRLTFVMTLDEETKLPIISDFHTAFQINEEFGRETLAVLSKAEQETMSKMENMVISAIQSYIEARGKDLGVINERMGQSLAVNIPANLETMDGDRVRQFVLDTERLQEFDVNDGNETRSNFDLVEEAQRHHNADMKEVVDGSVKVLEQVIKSESDKKWMGPIQAVTTQTTIRALFSQPMQDLVSKTQISAHKRIDRPDLQSGKKEIVLSVRFHNEDPKIHLSVQRDVNGDIAKVGVECKGTLALLWRASHDKDTVDSVVNPKMLEGYIKYDLTLDQGKSVITNLESNLILN